MSRRDSVRSLQRLTRRASSIAESTASGADWMSAANRDSAHAVSDLAKDASEQLRNTPRVADTLVILPTYNEAENIEMVVGRIYDSFDDVDILIVDDRSQDGTGDIADKMSLTNPDQLHVMHRISRDGLGGAIIAGLSWGLGREYSVIAHMDADGGHAPEQLLRLREAITGGADVVIGSRYVTGGVVRNWSWRRLTISRVANTYSRLALGVKIRDVTSGYKAYRREVLEKIEFLSVGTNGYSFQIEMTLRALLAGFKVAEVPITFTEREFGISKVDKTRRLSIALMVAQWGFRRRLNHARGLPQ